MSHSERVILSRTFLSHELPATDILSIAQCHVCQHWHKPIIHHGRSSSLVFLFLRQWSTTLRKPSRNIKKPPVGKSHQFALVLRSREALRSPLELSSTGFLFSRVVGLHRASSVAAGGGHDSARNRRISVTSQPWHATAVYLLLPGLDRKLITWASETYPQNTCWSSWRQHYSCRSQWQLLGPMALPWIALSPTTTCSINGTKLYEESLPFGASSLFDDLTLWDKVASRQRDNALYRGSAPFAVGKHVLLHIDTGYIRATTACLYAAVVLTSVSDQ